MTNNITKAKASLILDQPFFASLLLSMPMVEDASVKTMATDGETLWYNPEFASGLSLSETVFVLAHETMHCVFQHMCRRGTRNHNKWNIAADYVINEILITDAVGTMPKGGLHNPALVKQGNGTSEGVYALLPDSDESKGAGDDGGAMDAMKDAGTDEASNAAKQAEMKVRVIQAANAAKMCGKLSAGLARIVKDVTRNKVDWKSVLRRFLSERAKVDLSYAKPKRRFMADDINLPSLVGEKMGAIAIAVDCSGSVGDAELQAFSAEIKAIIEDISPSIAHVIYFDSEVVRANSFDSDSEFKIEAVGGGGTAFSPIFRYVDAQNISPIAMVILTDLQCSDFGESPSYPVLWASTDRNDAPFGEVLKIKD